MPFCMRKHHPDNLAAYGKDRAQIGEEDTFEFLIGNFGEFLFHIDAGVIDEDIDMAVAVNEVVDESGDGGKVIEVLAHGLAKLAQFFLSGVELFLVAANNNGEDGSLYEFLSDGQADARAATGNDRYALCAIFCFHVLGFMEDPRMMSSERRIIVLVALMLAEPLR